MNFFKFSWGATFETQVRSFIDQTQNISDWTDLYTPLNNLLGAASTSRIPTLPYKTEFLGVLIKASDPVFPQLVHGVLIDLIITFFKGFTEEELEDNIQVLMPPLFVMGKTALPLIRARCIEVVQHFVLVRQPLLDSMTEPIISCFSQSLLQPLNGLSELAFTLFKNVKSKNQYLFEKTMWVYLYTTPHTRQGLLHFMASTVYTPDFRNVTQSDVHRALCELLWCSDVLVVSKTLDFLNDKIPINSVVFSDDQKTKLIQIVLKLFTSKDSGIVQKACLWLIGTPDQNQFTENTKQLFLCGVNELISTFYETTIDTTQILVSIVNNKMLTEFVGNSLALPLLKLFIKINSKKYDRERSGAIQSILHTTFSQTFFDVFNSLEPTEKIVLAMYYFPSQTQVEEYTKFVISLFKTIVLDYFSKVAKKCDLPILEAALVIIKKLISSLHETLKLEISFLEVPELLRTELNHLVHVFNESEMSTFSNMMHLVHAFATITQNESFHSKLSDTLCEHILASENLASSLVCCKLYFKLVSVSQKYTKTNEIISFLWKNVSTGEQFVQIIISLLAVNAAYLPISIFKEIEDYERLLVCMHLSVFYEKMINTEQLEFVVFSLMKADTTYFKVYRDWFAFLMTRNPTFFITTILSVLIPPKNTTELVQTNSETVIKLLYTIKLNTTEQIERESTFVNYFSKLIESDIPGCLELLISAQTTHVMFDLLDIYSMPSNQTNTPISIVFFIIEQICVVRESIPAADLLITLFTRFGHSKVITTFAQETLKAVGQSLSLHTLSPVFSSKLLVLARILLKSTSESCTERANNLVLPAIDALPTTILVNPEILTDLAFYSPNTFLPTLTTKILPELFLKIPMLIKANNDTFYSNVLNLLGIVCRLTDRVFEEYPPCSTPTNSNITVFGFRREEHFFKPLIFGLFSMIFEVYNQLSKIQIKEIEKCVKQSLVSLLEQVFVNFTESLLEHVGNEKEHRQVFNTLFLLFPKPNVKLLVLTFCELFKGTKIPEETLYEIIIQILPVASLDDLMSVLPELVKFMNATATALQKSSTSNFFKSLKSLASCVEIKNVPKDQFLNSTNFSSLFNTAVTKISIQDDYKCFVSDVIPLMIAVNQTTNGFVTFFTGNNCLTPFVPQLESLLSQGKTSFVDDVLLLLQKSNLLTGKWQNIVVSIFTQNNFFSSTPSRLKVWMPIINTVFSQRIELVWKGSKGYSNRKEEPHNPLELRRAAFIVLCGKYGDFDKLAMETLTILSHSILLPKISDDELCSILLFVRVIIIKCSFVMVRCLFGTILYQLMDILMNNGDKEYSQNTILEALKIIDFANVCNQIDFDPLRWVFNAPMTGVSPSLFPIISNIIPPHYTPLNETPNMACPVITVHSIKKQEDTVELRKILANYNNLLFAVKTKQLDMDKTLELLLKDFVI
ncbi:hypothetical protein EIN_080780 [Entamoeba invadens IP1]|uniref:hypothetical protein n=1 Tax=Entamoeba invadens IP1 TaxID=370355 RepID=UPI0002C3DD17|nr:hypothetical protein EIN_080780 [Entamoeba invadens IP1]ELP85106.1 hypothetical protein EIN_080780 [Entamoeba invadens IP1]|eukprot:XP_004184452.1 hypothetical protein EIN_080780 [Entamoeba invadens IP1]